MFEEYKEIASAWFRDLRDQIRDEFLSIEKEFDPSFQSGFVVESWKREGGGGGEMSLMYGSVFEKIGVNISTVHGSFNGEFATKIPGALKSEKQFWASGISLVAHMKSPLVPAVHMNTRMIVTDNYWFGGGADLTPMYYNEEDACIFHSAFKEACDKHDDDYYNRFSKWADEYFFLKHRNEPRGIGGIFFDYLRTDDWQRDFAFTQDVGKCFLSVYPKLVRRNMYLEYTPEQREFQLLKRGRYVEFNLLYDRGTEFGLKTGGNTKAILMSLPPVAQWKDF
ncbi:coproporphyrinogen III oxidase family protein [Neorickettsia helminthoeca str. Oregon]|uniref:coproporphyrinogen oxidase n=1 Tax=Neorickettsia helminthoeca str. Oregon TaxID=1286528 RepID=X5HLR5_9RICK|nr:oxygen-dependent coproporphyrinogen oxidase [Neorickettsia helminthoeca]AHX11370.1 coproporphyrinogen III oxidase family protein [Neorickettsia helminthoeca str. Oregon]